MSHSPIDALLQVVKPRAGEAPQRAGESGSFGPALEQALAADRPASAPDTAPSRAAERPADDEDVDPHAVEHDGTYEHEGDEVEAEGVDESAVETSQVEESPGDELEISESAETAAGVATQQAPETNARATPAKHEAELQLAVGGEEAKTQATSPSDGGDAAQEDADETAGSIKKPVKPVIAATAEESILAPRTAEDDDERKPAEKAVRAEKSEPKTARRAATAPAAKSSGGEEEVLTEAVSSQPTTNRPAANVATEPTRETESPKPVPHENRKPTAGLQLPAPPVEATAVGVQQPQVSEGHASDKLAEEAGVRLVPADRAPPPQGTRGAGSLDRLTAPRAIHPSATPAEADGGLQVDRARFISRVEGAVRAAHQRDGRVQVRLSPPELGSLRIEITVQQGVLHARVEAETPAARNLLLDNLPALRERLAQQDMRVEKFDVDVRRDGGGQANGNGAQDRQADQPAWRDGNRSDRPGLNRQATVTRPSGALPAARISDAELDVRI